MEPVIASANEAADCSTAIDAFSRLVFDAHDTMDRCTNSQGVYAFASLAALSFAAFVTIDLLVALVRKHGFAAEGAGDLGVRRDGVGIPQLKTTLLIIIFGAVAAWIVAFFAAVVDFLQTAPHTAVATGVLWQVTYAQLLNRFGSTIKSPKDGSDQGTVPSRGGSTHEPEKQPETEEVAEAP